MNEKIKIIVEALDKKIAKDITVLEVTDLTSIADYFVIAAGTSNTQVRSLADEVEYQMGLAGFEPRQIEGRSSGWILLDYHEVVVHVFLEGDREHYNLEKLWVDAKPVDISAYLK